MIIQTLVFCIQLGILAFFGALELSLGMPIISMTLLFIFLKRHSLWWQLPFLVLAALIFSALTFMQWSATFLLLAGAWVLITVVEVSFSWVKGSLFLVSLLVTILFSWLAHLSLNWQTGVCSFLFLVIAFSLVRTLRYRKDRQRSPIIDWIAMGE